MCPGASYLMNPLTQSLTGKIEKRFFFLLIFPVIRFFWTRPKSRKWRTENQLQTLNAIRAKLFYRHKCTFFEALTHILLLLNNKHIHPFFLKKITILKMENGREISVHKECRSLSLIHVGKAIFSECYLEWKAFERSIFDGLCPSSKPIRQIGQIIV